MIHRSLPIALRRGRFFLASGLGVTMLAASGLAQVQPGTGQEASAPGADRTAAPNARATTTESQGRADQAAPDRVVITGSFIPTAEGEGALPVSVFTQDDLRKGGNNSAAEGLRKLPSFTGNVNSENNSNGRGADGSAGVNLRGLGQENTLVLVNGHRAGNPSLNSGFTNVNFIPFSAIDHIEVLKDGASAQYGSDAVAGVVNFVLKTQFEGAQVDVLYGNTTNNDAGTERASVITGFSTKDKRFNIVLDANFYHANGIYSRDRFLSSVGDASRFGGENSQSSSYPGRISVTGASRTAAGGGNLVLIDGLASAVTPTSIADYRPYGAGTGTQGQAITDGFNFHLYSPAIPEQERFSYYGATDYQIIPDNVLDVYAYGIYSNNRNYNGLAPAPVANLGTQPLNPAYSGDLITRFGTGATSELAVLRSSPYNPVGNDLTGLRYRTLVLGNRVSNYDAKAYDFSGGLKGTIKTFSYDAFLSHVEDKTVDSNSGDIRRSTILSEIADGSFNPFVGASASNTGTLNGSTYDNVAALQRAAYHVDTVTFDNLNFAELRLTNVFFPDAPQGGVAVALGGEYRRESFDQGTGSVLNPPPTTSADTVGGFNTASVFHAVQDVRSVFGELRLPVVTPGMNIPGIYNLAFTVSGRYQKFLLNGIDPTVDPLTGLPLNRAVTPSFETTNPKYDVRYQPVPDVTFRASYSTAFRAPSLGDLFTPLTVGSDSPQIVDPLKGGGLSSYQPRGDSGGVSNLQPEETDAYTAGLVLSPRFVPGFNVTIDYYQVNQSNVIAAGPAQFIVDQAAQNPGGALASRVVRNPDTQEIISINESPFNGAKRYIEGIDITASYELPLERIFKRDLGKINLTLNYNHFFRFTTQIAPGAGFTDRLGKYSPTGALAPGSIPYNKALAQFEYQKDIGAFGIMPKSTFDFVATVNYIGDFADDSANSFGGQDPTVINGVQLDPDNPTFPRNRKVREYTTLDLQLSYTIQPAEKVEAVTTTSKDGKDGKRSVSSPGTSPSIISRLLGGTTLTVGCNDVFDTPPPFAAGSATGANDNYDTSLYTIRNRFIYGAISKKF